MAGSEVTVVDVNPARAAVARALGVGFAVPDFAPDEADLVVHASGSPSGLELALRLAGFEATVLEMSWYGDQTVTLPLGGAFHAKRLTIKSSQVGHVAAAQRARWDAKRRIALALGLLQDAALDALITGESAFEELPLVMPQLAAAPAGTLCHRIRYR
jgi:threonine dehydrogenase-like Zn-dependent dehydrogenase